MKTYIALLRGINVVGKNVLPMKELTAVMEHLGCANVRTYIQSGNAAFEGGAVNLGRLSTGIGREIWTRRGFEPRVLLLRREDLERAVAANPFPEAVAKPHTLHLAFLAEAAKKPDLEALAAVALPSERFRLIGRAFYVHAPDGFGTSKLAGGAERILGVAMTFRNWRTVSTILDMAGKPGGSDVRR